MEHIAIMKKEFLEMVISGTKTIESRWYKFRKPPFECVKTGETVYFKETGKPVTLKAEAEKVIFYDDLDKEKIKGIIKAYGARIGINLQYLEKISDKKLCTLIFLKNVQRTEPFSIDKAGFGNMCAWITVDSMDKIKKV